MFHYKKLNPNQEYYIGRESDITVIDSYLGWESIATIQIEPLE